MDHAKFSPSGAHRWMECPGQPSFCANIPDIESTYADDGHLAHALAEDVLTTGDDTLNMYGAKINGTPIPDEMVAYVAEYVDFVRDAARHYAYSFTEKQVTLDWLIPEPRIFGTCDTVLATPYDRVHIIDFKYGIGVPVHVIDNPQLMIYALGVAGAYDFEHATLSIVQPRRPIDGATCRSWSVSADDLISWGRKVLKPAIERACASSELIAGDHCRFCRAARNVSCPVFRSHMTSSLPAIPDAAANNLPEPESLSEEQLGDLIAKLSLVSGYLASCKEQALHRMLAGLEVPGLKLVKPRVHRKWHNECVAKETLQAWLPTDAIEEKKLLSPSKIELALKTKAGLSAKDAKAAVVPLCAVNDNDKLTIASASDPRKAVQPSFSLYDDVSS